MKLLIGPEMKLLEDHGTLVHRHALTEPVISSPELLVRVIDSIQVQSLGESGEILPL
jgi:hypothetical protein